MSPHGPATKQRPLRAIRAPNDGAATGTMALHERVKTALDETRTLILGVQILLGFQYQSVFQERFEALPPHARSMDSWAQGLMLLATGLLIAPSAFHRIAENGASTGRIHALTGRLAAAALLPFAATLGPDLTIALELARGGPWLGGIAGVGAALLALTAWYGMGEAMKQQEGAAERRKAEAERGKCETAPLHARIEQMLTEARVLLPGAQALLGFQLIIILTSAFEKLPEASRLLHGASLLCVALAVILLVTPPALHRIIWAGEDSEGLAVRRAAGLGGAGAARSRHGGRCLCRRRAHGRLIHLWRSCRRGGAGGASRALVRLADRGAARTGVRRVRRCPSGCAEPRDVLPSFPGRWPSPKMLR